MLTNFGQEIVKRYLARNVPVIGKSVGVGVGLTPALITDTKLGYEVARFPVGGVAIKDNGDIFFKCPIPVNLICDISELALFFASPEESDSQSLLQGIVAELWSGNVTWVPGRIGSSSPLVNGTANVAGLNLNISRFLDSDKISIAFNSDNTGGLVLKIGSDSTNYYTYAFTSVAGYNVLSLNFNNRSTTGSPDPTNCTYIDIVGTNSRVDGVKIDRTNQVEISHPVDRSVLSTNYAKVEGEAELELILKVIFS